MANRWHLSRLKLWITRWKQWREKHFHIQPDLTEANLRNANFRGFDLRKANLYGAILVGADLSQANLSETNLSEADLSQANLSEADLSETNLREANLNKANLKKANLLRATLYGTNLVEADLVEANLIEANLSLANLNKTNFQGANLKGANLKGANLSEANLSEANLVWANFNETDLKRSNLGNANLLVTSFGNTDLSDAKDLDRCSHEGPSILDPLTISRSGYIPSSFLQGCGYLDWQIEALKLHRKGISQKEIIDILYRIANLKTGEPLQYASCFISYSSADERFCQKLHDCLQAKGIRTWYAPHGMRWGEKLFEGHDRVIHLPDRLLLVLTEESMRSPWVEYEIRSALKREKDEGRRILFPIRLVNFETILQWQCLDVDTGEDLARRVREFYIPGDFAEWENEEAFERAFERLIQDLREAGNG